MYLSVGHDTRIIELRSEQEESEKISYGADGEVKMKSIENDELHSQHLFPVRERFLQL